MRDGFRVFDSDTHFHPSVESLVPYFDRDLKAREAELGQFVKARKYGRAGQLLTEPELRHYYSFPKDKGEGWGGRAPRHLGEAAPREGEERPFQTFMGERRPTVGAEDFDIAARIREMDEEGVDTQLLVTTPMGGHKETAVELGLLQAHHRFVDDVCSQYPGRLTAMININSRLPVEDNVAEIKTWGKKPWAVALKAELPLDYPLDHPDLLPIWAAAEEQGLCITHHSFSAGYPGYRDLWDNPFIGRTASHPWAAMRAIASFMGAGLMDRFPQLRFAILESGFGWLPFWMKRMEDQVVYMGYVAENLQHTMTEYMTDGRFYAAVVLHEGPDMVRMVNELMGDQVLMFSSDYPHAESRFPGSVDLVVDWDVLSREQKQKMLWDNAARCFNVS